MSDCIYSFTHCVLRERGLEVNFLRENGLCYAYSGTNIDIDLKVSSYASVRHRKYVQTAFEQKLNCFIWSSNAATHTLKDIISQTD